MVYYYPPGILASGSGMISNMEQASLLGYIVR
jgi:hypothetical protein